MSLKPFLPLLLTGGTLAFLSSASAYPGPNLCPTGEESTPTTLKIYAETKQFYLNICKNKASNQFYLTGQQKSNGKSFFFPVEKSNNVQIYSGTRNDNNHYYSINAGEERTLEVFAGNQRILRQSLLPNVKFYQVFE
jgi:hypothetical protein